jgi:hypothetical protein
MFRNGRGHDAVLRYFDGVNQMDIHTFAPRAFPEAGEVVVVELDMDFTHRTTGKRGVFEEIHRFTVGGDGRITRYRPFVDTATFVDVFTPEG